jgi:hypothetical protein
MQELIKTAKLNIMKTNGMSICGLKHICFEPF